MKTHDQARAALADWRAAASQNFYSSDTFLQRVLRHHLGDALAAEADGLTAFGAEVAGELDALIRENNRDENLPRLRKWDGLGNRIDQVVFHPSYDRIGELTYRTGVMARYAEPGNETLQLAYGYLAGLNGEGGHTCPLACTAGLIKILQAQGTEAQKAKFLPGLLRADRLHPAHFHGAQFLTEIQGGSDVGANACVATEADDGTWRINGEKWFCSVIDADLYLMTARPHGMPPGTAGLSAFVVPRVLDDGTLNGVHVRRLKYKLGTRSMASGEADFIDAVGHRVEGGFNAVVELVLNTSRLYNAVITCASMRRVEIEANAYADHRTAFKRPIRQFPLVAATLQRIADETRAATAGSFELAAMADRMAVGAPEDGDPAVYRLVVNMNKYWTSIRNTAVIHDGIEVLGGNGAIEDFSVLPRLYRDAIVCESWEGTHNVLCAQVLRDLHRFQLHDAFFTRMDRIHRLAADCDWLEVARKRFAERVAVDRQNVAALLEAPEAKAAYDVRGVVDRLSVTWQAACLLKLSAADGQPTPVLTRLLG